MNSPIGASRLAAILRQTAGLTLFRDVSVASLLLFLALLLPFVLSYHRNPIPSFFQEWLAIFLALAATILIAARYRSERFEWPVSVWIPLALVPGVMVHAFSGNPLIIHGPPLHLTYLGSAVLLMVIGRRLQSVRETVSLADVMAAAFVTGALASSVASWHWRYKTGVFDSLPWEISGGWIAQRNQNALHIWLGVLGIGHFALGRKLSWGIFFAGIAILVEAAMHTQSRSAYLYAGFGLVLTVCAAAKSPSRDVRRRLLLIGICPVIFLGAIQGMRLLAGSMVQPSGAIERYAPTTLSQDPRVGLWLSAARIVQSHPWIGAGPGSYIRESWVISDSLPDWAPTTIPTTHAHNLFLQIAAELGTPTALALAALIAAWLFLALRQDDWQSNWLHVAIPVAILTHNQVEFSLWYLYFLVPVALSMGAATQRVVGQHAPAIVILIVALLGLVFTVRLGQDYRTVVESVAKAHADQREIGLLLDAAAHPVFGAWASTEIAGDSWPTDITSQVQDEHSRRALFVSPLKKTALLWYVETLKNEGKSAEAGTELRAIRRVFGNDGTGSAHAAPSSNLQEQKNGQP